MKNPALLLLLLAFPVMQSAAADTATLRQYYNLVHRAAVHVCKNELSSATPLYESAFALVPYPFYTDISNALYVQVNDRSPDTAKIVRYLRLIQQKGTCVHEYYAKQEQFAPYLSLVGEKDCKKVVSREASERIRIAIAKDQEIRRSHNRTAYKKVDVRNYLTVDSIFRLAEQADMPLENYIGWLGEGHCFTILNHNASLGIYNKFLAEKLVRKGLLDARMMASQLDYYYSRGSIKAERGLLPGDDCRVFSFYGSMVLTLSMDRAVIKVPSPLCLQEINKARRSLFLPDVIENAKIVVFAASHVNAGFSYHGILFLALPPEDMALLEQKFRKQYKIIAYDWRKDFDFNRTAQ